MECPIRLSLFCCLLALAASSTVASHYHQYYPIPGVSQSISNNDDETFSVLERQQRETTYDQPLGYYRLPNDTRPEHYAIRLTSRVHANDFSFTGEVDITVRVQLPTTTITIHHRQLTINTIRLTGAAAVDVPLQPASGSSYELDREFLVISLATGVAPLTVDATYVLRISYAGTLRNDLAGFYRSSYVAADGSTKWLAVTQFAATDARHAFPCYDEPSMRATYDISITHGADYHALSNMPTIGQPTPIAGSDMVTTTFQRTPLIPTYLIAFMISDFVHVSSVDANNFEQRVYHRPTAVVDSLTALKHGVKVQAALNSYLEIDYPLPKMDHVGLQGFHFGAMENWGMITYKEENLLLTERSTFIDEKRAMTIISHEFAHQWFGNLVTPKWWTYVWLNEGFATLFEFYTTNWVLPEWKILDHFVLTVQNVMQFDATNSTRAMSHYEEKADIVFRLYDQIAYPKSASVLRMFLHAFTESTFKKGLTHYLKKMNYLAATEDDLFDSMEWAVRQDGSIPASLSLPLTMKSWTQQKGFPFLTVTRDYSNHSFSVRQDRYTSFVPILPNADASIWWIPINYATKSMNTFNETTPNHWLTTKSENYPALNVPNSDWLILNKQQTGYYRVLYDAENYRLIADELFLGGNLNNIHLTSRAQLIDDAFEFAKTGRLNYTILFDILRYLEREVEYVPWQAAFNGLNFVNRMMRGSDEYGKFLKFISKITARLYDVTGQYEIIYETINDKHNRVNVLRWACLSGVQKCRDDTLQLFREYIKGTRLHQNTADAVMCAAMLDISQEDYVRVWSRLQALSNDTMEAGERQSIIVGMACVANKKMLTEYLQTSVGSTAEVGYKSVAERYRVFTEVAAHNDLMGTEVAIQFLLDNLSSVRQMYGTAELNSGIILLATHVVNDDLLEDMEMLLEAARLTSYVTVTTIENAERILNENMHWADQNQRIIEKWLIENSAGSAKVSIILVVASAILYALK